MSKQKFCKPNFPERKHMLVVAKEPSRWDSFIENPKHVFTFMHKKIVKILLDLEGISVSPVYRIFEAKNTEF